MFFRIVDEKLLEKYKTIWTKIKELKYIKLNALSVYDCRYINKKIMVLNFMLTLVAKMFKKTMQNMNLLHSFLLILYLFPIANITCTYI